MFDSSLEFLDNACDDDLPLAQHTSEIAVVRMMDFMVQIRLAPFQDPHQQLLLLWI